MPLAEISRISIEKGPWNWNILSVVLSDKTHRFIIKEGDPEALMRMIEERIGRNVSSAPEEKSV